LKNFNIQNPNFNELEVWILIFNRLGRGIQKCRHEK